MPDLFVVHKFEKEHCLRDTSPQKRYPFFSLVWYFDPSSLQRIVSTWVSWRYCPLGG